MGFTDGDLRRVFISNINTHNIMHLMTKNPIVFESDERVSNVLNKMEEYKISNIFFVKKSVSVGNVHIYDLLQLRVKK